MRADNEYKDNPEVTGSITVGQEVDTKEKNSIDKTIKQYAIWIVLCVVTTLILRNFVITRADVDGISMKPTLNDKDVVFVEKLSVLRDKYSRRNVVIFNAPDTKSDIYIKRVIGIAGDEVEIRNGKVYLNGEELEENYLADGTVTEPREYMLENRIVKVPEKCIFVMGDNREHSKDSRFFGPIPVESIQGRALFRFLPLKGIKGL